MRLPKNKMIAFAAAWMLFAPLAGAQSTGEPQVIIGGGQQNCANMNSVQCVNGSSRSTNTLGRNGSLDSNQSKGFVQEYREGLNDSTDVEGIVRPTTYCTGPNGEIIPHRSVLRFFFFERSANCVADSELRECVAGVLSGSASFASCDAFRSCSGPGYSLNHGQSGTFSNAPRSSGCQTAQRTCNDGTLGGNTSLSHFGTCTPFASCTHQGVTIAHGASRNFWRTTVSTNCAADRTTVSCNDGVVSGSNLNYAATSCRAPAGCTHQGVSMTSGSTRDFWRVALSSNCAAERTTVTCNDGTVSGSNLNYAQTSCAAPASCTARSFSWTSGSNGCSGNAATTASGSTAMITSSNGNSGTARAACNNGVWGSLTNATCTSPAQPSGDPQPANCTYRGVEIPNGQSRFYFRVQQSANCSAERTTIACNNGVLSGNTSYQFTSCAVPPAQYSDLHMECTPVLDNLQSASGSVRNNSTGTRQSASMGTGLHYVPNDGTPETFANACRKIIQRAGCSDINTSTIPMTGRSCSYDTSQCSPNPKNSGVPAYDSTDVICPFDSVTN